MTSVSGIDDDFLIVQLTGQEVDEALFLAAAEACLDPIPFLKLE